MKFYINDVLILKYFLVVCPIIVISACLTNTSLFQFLNVNAQDSNDILQNITNEVGELLYQGDIQFGYGNYTRAFNYYDKALTLDPNDTSALGTKGFALWRLGNFSEALHYYDKSLAVDPNDRFVLDLKGSALMELRNYTGALDYYDKALTLDPNSTSILSSKGMALSHLGNFSEALHYYNTALTLNPYDDYASNLKSAVLFVLNAINETNILRESLGIANLTRESTPYDLQLGSHLILDPEAFSHFGDGYTIDKQKGVYVIFDRNWSDYSIYQLPRSEQNLVQISDSQISVDIAFKIPVRPDSTMESIERIEGLYDVKYIDTQPDYKKFIAFSNSPITINNTQYSDLTIELKKFNNDTGILYINGYEG